MLVPNHVWSIRVGSLFRTSQRTYHYTVMSKPYSTEEQVAVSAVRRACSLTASVFNKLVRNETLVKGDKSPVTGMFPIIITMYTILSACSG